MVAAYLRRFSNTDLVGGRTQFDLDVGASHIEPKAYLSLKFRYAAMCSERVQEQARDSATKDETWNAQDTSVFELSVLSIYRVNRCLFFDHTTTPVCIAAFGRIVIEIVV